MLKAELTCGESLKIIRRRVGQTQEAAAKASSVSLSHYYQVEQDITVDKSFEKHSIKVKDLTELEKCYICRLRAGLTQDQLSEKMKVTRTWLNLMETGKEGINHKPLLEYWMGRPQ